MLLEVDSEADTTSEDDDAESGSECEPLDDVEGSESACEALDDVEESEWASLGDVEELLDVSFPFEIYPSSRPLVRSKMTLDDPPTYPHFKSITTDYQLFAVGIKRDDQRLNIIVEKYYMGKVEVLTHTDLLQVEHLYLTCSAACYLSLANADAKLKAMVARSGKDGVRQKS